MKFHPLRALMKKQARTHATLIYNEMTNGLKAVTTLDPTLRPCGMVAAMVLQNNPKFKPSVPGNVLNFVHKSGKWKIAIDPTSSFNDVIRSMGVSEIIANTSFDSKYGERYLGDVVQRLEELFESGLMILGQSLKEQSLQTNLADNSVHAKNSTTT